MTGNPDHPVQQAAANSLAGRTLIVTLATVQAAWRDATSVKVLRSDSILRLVTEWNLRTAALTIMSASLWHMALRTQLPAYATSALPLWCNLLVSLIALLVAWQAATITAAWPHSTAGRLWRRLFDH